LKGDSNGTCPAKSLILTFARSGDISYILSHHEYHACKSEAVMPEILQRIDLTPEEISKFPVELRRKIEAAFRLVDKKNGAWMLVGTPSARAAMLVERALVRLPALVSARSAAIQEHNIDKLLEIIAGDVPYAVTDAEIDLENAEMRSTYLAEVKLLTAAQVHEQSGLGSRNKSEPASRWKRERKIFAVRKGVTYLYPAFQFENGQPRPIIGKILAEITDKFTPW